MKNLYVISFSLVFVILCACEPEDNYGEKTFSHPNHHNRGQNNNTKNVSNNGNRGGTKNTSGLSNKSLDDIQLELTSLERSLTRNFGYKFVYRAGLFQKIVPPKQIANTPSVSFKFYKDSLEYGAYSLFLEKNKSRYLKKGATHYDQLLKRTFSMITLIHNPTLSYVLHQLNSLEQNDYDFKVNVLIDSLNIKIALYAPLQRSAQNAYSAKSRSVFAANLCSMLGALNRFNLSGVTKRHCNDFEKVNFIRRIKTNRSLKENTVRINSKILKKSMSLVQSTMKASSIFLDVNSTVGIDTQKRKSFETNSYKINTQYSKNENQIALNNNLYENLYFLLEVLEAKQTVLGLNNKENRNYQAALRAIASVTYKNNDFSIGLSPYHSDIFAKTTLNTASNAPAEKHVDQNISLTSSDRLLDQRNTITLDSPTTDEIRLNSITNLEPETLQASALSEQSNSGPEVQSTPETTVNNNDALLAQGNSSNAPLNTFEKTPISLPEDVEEFFND